MGQISTEMSALGNYLLIKTKTRCTYADDPLRFVSAPAVCGTRKYKSPTRCQEIENGEAHLRARFFPTMAEYSEDLLTCTLPIVSVMLRFLLTPFSHF